MENVQVSTNYINDCVKARQLELQHDWLGARNIWKSLNRSLDVAVTELIIDANAKGDEYRRLTESVFQDFENRKINIYEFQAKLTEAHNKVYIN